MQICTIVARNYLAAARVLAGSFLAHNPGGVCWALIVDDLEQEVDGADEPFTVVRPAELGIERWHQMVAGYSVLELSTAVKPWLLRHLLHEQGTDRVAYLDPDIQVFSSLQDVDDLLTEHAVVVTPHLTDPMPRDDRSPAETDILVSGSFNLGFAGFAAGEQVDALLDWWAERLATDCLVAPERGFFVDQRWMDLAPGLIPSLHVLRDPGYNVAYWNLATRDVRREEDGYTVNGAPLRFFHFSGYDPARPAELSKHQNRISLRDRPLLAELCDGYARALAEAGHEQSRTRPYAFGSLSDGTRLDAAARSVYRAAAAAGELDSLDVFSPPGTATFLAYLRGPAMHGEGQGVSRYLEALRDSRADLREAFADLEGPDGARLVAWAELSQGEVAPALIGEGASVNGPPGVNMVGYFKGVMGVGEHTRQLAAALRTQQIPVTTTSLQPEAAAEDESLADPASVDGPVDESLNGSYFNLLSVNADSVPAVAERLGGRFFTDRYSIGFWAWEVSTFPDRLAGAFAHLDEVWVGSRHVRDAVADHASVPVLAIPQPVSLAADWADAPAPPGLPEGFCFLFAFDYLSVFERKNPLAVIQAFSRAFSPGSGVCLIIKTLNDDHDPVARERLRTAAAAHPDIHLMSRRLSARERDGLMRAADCFVSLHRAEGFGYSLAESMWAGKPVIATGYSGNTDFMTPDNSYLVDYRLVPIGPGHDPYPPDGEWAEPDVEQAAALMREVVAQPDAAAQRGARAAADIRRSHSPEVAGAAMAARLRRVLASPAWRSSRRGAGRPGPLYTDWVNQLIRSGPTPPGVRPRFGAPQRAARRGLLRMLKPVVVHEGLVDRELLKAIEKVDANLRALSASHAAALRQIEELQGEVRRLSGENGTD
jgi:glycosyltransferase involved in cell wall biosynthesis